MKYLKIAGVVWGFAYFLFGTWSSFTLNANDTWTSVALLFGIFLLPLPIAVMAIWLAKLAGKALFVCVAVNVVAVAAVAVTAYPLAGIGRFVVPGAAHHITQRGTNRQTIFFTNSDRRLYLDLLAMHFRLSRRTSRRTSEELPHRPKL